LPIVEWLGNVTTTADEAITASEDMSQGERDGAKAFLQYQLKDGPKPAVAIKAEAMERSISGRTLDRAKQELNVMASKMGSGQWMWSLPNNTDTTLPKEEDNRTF